jgi:hypothetical protein
LSGKVAAIFQFFYSSKEKRLPHAEVPTRDVTNTHGQGHKTEPNLERSMENWCSCRPRHITKAAKAAQNLAENGRQHYLVLTTRHPETGKALAVGLMPFSQIDFTTVMREHRNRWGDRLPYVSDNRLKLCSFSDAFPLEASKSKDGKEHVPGSRYATVHVPDELLAKIVRHFASKRSTIEEFLRNVRFLEARLAKENPADFQDYSRRNKSGASGRCK